MARDKRKRDEKKASTATKRAAKSATNGRAPKLDSKVARAIDKRVKKLARQLNEAARLESKRVRALDKAHRRRQLIQAALEELAGANPKTAAWREAPAEPAAVAPASPATEPAADSPKAAAPKPRTPRRRGSPAKPKA